MMKLFVALCVLSLVAAVAPPALPTDWSASEDSDMLIAQGAMKMGEYICCDPTAQGTQCKVQAQNQQIQHYFGYSQNKTRLEADGEVIIDLFYPTYKEVEVDPATLKCKSWCPIDNDLYPLEIYPNATDLGQKTVGGVVCENYHWTEYILKIIPMEQHNFFVNMNADGTAVPVRDEDQMTPFGQPMGTQNVTWSNFKAGPQDPKLFAVTDLASCPQDPNCDDSHNSMRMMARLMDRRPDDFAKMFAHLKEE
jgi:hypothetical protein